jgi:hypothetical protein
VPKLRILSQTITVEAGYEPANGRLELRKWRTIVAGVAGPWVEVASLDGPPIAGFDRVVELQKPRKRP